VRAVVPTQLDYLGDFEVKLEEDVTEIQEARTYTLRDGLGGISRKEDFM
jgi:hypothetical protein